MQSILDETKIAGNFKVKDWKALRYELINNIELGSNNIEVWKKAWDLFYTRVNTRFLEPINRIIENGTKKGEGFTVTAIQCILIEFLQAFYEGKVYNPSNKPNKPNEYKSSRGMYIRFLHKQLPFCRYFTKDLAKGFYTNIRCGLLHEASTKETSVIKSEHEDMIIESIDKSNMILYRTNFQEALIKYLKLYKENLFQTRELKINFIRKFDEIAGINNIYYFAYGSNMDKQNLDNWCKENNKPLVHIFSIQTCILRNFQLRFNYYSKRRDAGAANIMKSQDDCVYGLLLEINKQDMNVIHYKEGVPEFYNEFNIKVELLNKAEVTEVSTFKVTKEKEKSEHVPPKREYIESMIQIAKFYNFPEDYVYYLNNIKTNS